MDDRTPAGERDVFNLLSAGPDDWVALHSLDLAPWNNSLRTEIDFLVLIPDAALLCIEVKSHAAISFENDRWYPPEIKRSPFKQASDARHTFYRRLRDLAPQFRYIPVVDCCIFPRAIFDVPPNLSVQAWQLIDSRAFGAFTSSTDFCASLRARALAMIAADPHLQKLPHPISSMQIEAIVRTCLPVQRRRTHAREEIEQREQEIERILRDQQKPVLQLTEMNDRLVVEGPAGTGKTLIAIEVARRAAERGQRVALLCFNQLIGDWMRHKIAADRNGHPNLIAGRAIRVIADMSGVSIPPDPPSDYWDNELPDRISERLTDPDFEASAEFEFLVLDEAQDLLARPRLWECVTSFLRGGAVNGSFCLFGDFENQVLGAREPMNQSLATLRAIAKPAAYRLTENCRNYRIIGDSAVRLSGLEEPVYRGYRRVGGGIQNYDIFFYKSDAEQRHQLLQWLEEFKQQGYRPSEITILSFGAPEQSVASRLAAEGRAKLRPVWQNAAHLTGYASVHAFKGLENKIIILTDVFLGAAEFNRDLFYTGMTRASESVRILCDSGSQEKLVKWITERQPHDRAIETH
jgi:hypothetical protein